MKQKKEKEMKQSETAVSEEITGEAAELETIEAMTGETVVAEVTGDVLTESAEETAEGEDSDELTMSEREELEQLRKERDERNIKEKAYDKLYDNLHISVRALDIFIGAMVVLFLFIVIKGMGLI